MFTNIYRYRIWQDESSEEGYAFDTEIHIQDIPEEILETFHRPGEVYSIFSEVSELGDQIPVFMILSDDLEKISKFVQGLRFGINLDKMFENSKQNSF